MRHSIAKGIVSFALLVATLYAQATGRLGGVVQDATGAAVAGATVACRNLETGLVHQTLSTDAGVFHFPDLPIGNYELKISKTGFKALVEDSVEVLTGHTLDLHLQLTVGAVSESIEVAAAAPLVQNATSEVQTTVDSRAMQEIPLNGRNLLELVVLTPGASFTSEGTIVGQQDNIGVVVNGLRSTDNNYQLDGASFNNNHFGSAPTLPNPDTLQEFTVQSANFSARESRAGAVVQLSTRSGTNQWHGSVFDFVRNHALDARNFFDDDRAAFHRHQAGGTAGGPVRHDRTFVFASYQATLQTGAPSLKLITVPSVAQRTGDFTAFAGKVIVDPANGQPFPGSIIPQSRFNPNALKLLQYVPNPDQPNGNNIRRQVDSDLQDYQLLVRVDHRFSVKDNVSLRYFTDWNDFQRDTASLPGVYSENKFKNRILTLSDTHVFTPRFSSTTSFSWTETYRDQIPISPVYSKDFSSIAPANNLTNPELRVNVTNYFNFMSGGPLTFQPGDWALRHQMQWFRGRHAISFGADIAWQHEYAADASLGSGAWTFNATNTSNTAIRGSVGDSVASFLLGLPATFQQMASDGDRIKMALYQFWVQDDWKVRPRLTLNVGLRWEPYLAPVDHQGPLPGFLPGVHSKVAPGAPTGIVFSGDIRDSIYPPDWSNFAPRVGFAWDVTGKSNTVIRGGYGIYYRQPPLNIQRSAATTAAFRGLNVNISVPKSFEDPYLGVKGGDPFPYTTPTLDQLQTYKFATPTVTSALDASAHSSYTQSWNLAVERQLRRDLTMSAGYVGNHSLGVISGIEGNPSIFGPGATAANTDARRIYAAQGLGSVTLYTGWQWARYNALQVNVTKRTARGLSIIANYVFGKSMDNATNGTQAGASGQPRNPASANMDRGLADVDRKQVANVSLLYDVPRLRSVHGFAGAVVNGWQTNAIIKIQSGLPITVLSGANRSLVGISKDHADQVGNAARPAGADPLTQWFNTAAFVVNAPGTFGTTGRSILRGPTNVTTNVSVFKIFPVSERLRLQFRCEAFNFLNRANFDSPTANVSNVNNGKILTAQDPRVVQLVLKVMF